jgi:hypothetical protein
MVLTCLRGNQRVAVRDGEGVGECDYIGRFDPDAAGVEVAEGALQGGRITKIALRNTL